MLQFVSNQAGDFPDLFSDPLCSTFQGSNGNGSSSGALEPQLQRPYSQVQLQSFPPPPASPQLQSLPVKAAQTTPPAPPRSAPVLQPRPSVQPQLQQQAVMITPTFSSAPQTRIIQQPVIYQNAATSFQGSACSAQATGVPGAHKIPGFSGYGCAWCPCSKWHQCSNSKCILSQNKPGDPFLVMLLVGCPFCLRGIGVGEHEKLSGMRS